MRVRRRKHISQHRGPVPAATTRNEYWSMDFVHDQLANGRAFRVLTVIDKWSRERVLLETSFSLTGQSVVDALQQMSLERPLPKGTEFTSKLLDEWAWNNGVKFDFIRPRKPTENAFIESFNGRLRDECPERERVRLDRGCSAANRDLAAGLQSSQTTQLTRSPDPE